MASSSSRSGAALTSFWLKFFTEAGIPAGDATNYAISFSDHRISEEMLMDLNKEILHDIGVTLMGDVIGILKHAKSVHAQTAREKVLKGTVASSTSRESSTPTNPRRSTPSRTVNHYLAADPDARPMSEPAPPKVSSISQEMACRLGPSPSQSGTSVKVKLGLAQKEEVPVPKIRRVFPEHEGKYKVTMPAGTTAKTRKILEEQGLAIGETRKFSVFDRLGIESSGSPGASSSPKVTVTGLGKIVIGNKAGVQSAGVFERLGGKKSIKRAATSTTDDHTEPLGAVEYAGVLKLGASPAKKQKTVPKMVTLQKTIEQRLGPKHPDSTSSASGVYMDVESTQLKTPLKNRLGKNLITSPATSTVMPPKTLVKTVSTKAAIKARLGQQKAEATSTNMAATRLKKVALRKPKTGGVFGRLGKQM